MLFDADRGFERWAAERRKKGKNSAQVSANGNSAAHTMKFGMAGVVAGS